MNIVDGKEEHRIHNEVWYEWAPDRVIKAIYSKDRAKELLKKKRKDEARDVEIAKLNRQRYINKNM